MATTTSLEEVLGTLIILVKTSEIRMEISNLEEEIPMMMQPNKEISSKENTITEMITPTRLEIRMEISSREEEIPMMVQPNKEISSKENTVTEMITPTSLEEVLGTMIHLEEGSSKEMDSKENSSGITKGEEGSNKNKETTALEILGTKQKIDKNSAAMVAEASKTVVASTDMLRAISVDRIMMIEDRIMMIGDTIMEDRIMMMASRMEECLTW